MFVITNCIGDIVGRPQGYKKHATAQHVAERRGRIKTAIYTAFHSHYDGPTRQGADGTRLLYRIEWQDSPE
jgi:hypothetical protein